VFLSSIPISIGESSAIDYPSQRYPPGTISTMHSFSPRVMPYRTTLSASSFLLLMFLRSSSIVCAHNRQDNNARHSAWGGMPNSFLKRQPSHDFLDECQSVASFLHQMRGGGRQDDDYYSRYNDDNDDRYDSNRNYDRSSRRNEQEDDEGDYYDYRDDSRSSSSTPPVKQFLDFMPDIIKNGDRRIGLGLLGSGSIISMLGISLFFNKSLMRLGNLLFIAGVPMTLGPSRTMGYFLQPQKTRATACLALGIFLVFIGMPVFGIILEVFGILNLFGNMFPVLLAIAKNMPVIGPILSGNNNNRNDNRQRREEEYYDDGEAWDRGYEQDDYRRDDDRRRDDDQYHY
jgi:hypothetical protein